MKIRFYFFLFSVFAKTVCAQIPPSPTEVEQYNDLFAAVAEGDVAEVKRLIAANENLEIRDSAGRTPVLVAAHFSHDDVVEILLEANADVNALDQQRYDLITIAAVNNDVQLIRLGLEYGADPTATTSPYDGTALIAAAHLGHVETVRELIAAGAPLDHINNLHWTALIEAIVLGDGGERHTKIVKILIDAGADTSTTDRNGRSPLELAQERGYTEMIRLLDNVHAQ